mmetsp:Transcript_30574/g.66691  ORF Transcript_30574/g.66691 Transcript_30574/m.66691 type:complete len:396 (+) Transcript_30574:214-1401(+)
MCNAAGQHLDPRARAWQAEKVEDRWVHFFGELLEEQYAVLGGIAIGFLLEHIEGVLQVPPSHASQKMDMGLPCLPLREDPVGGDLPLQLLHHDLSRHRIVLLKLLLTHAHELEDLDAGLEELAHGCPESSERRARWECDVEEVHSGVVGACVSNDLHILPAVGLQLLLRSFELFLPFLLVLLLRRPRLFLGRGVLLHGKLLTKALHPFGTEDAYFVLVALEVVHPLRDDLQFYTFSATDQLLDLSPGTQAVFFANDVKALARDRAVPLHVSLHGLLHRWVRREHPDPSADRDGDERVACPLQDGLEGLRRAIGVADNHCIVAYLLLHEVQNKVHTHRGIFVAGHAPSLRVRVGAFSPAYPHALVIEGDNRHSQLHQCIDQGSDQGGTCMRAAKIR